MSVSDTDTFPYTKSLKKLKGWLEVVNRWRVDNAIAKRDMIILTRTYNNPNHKTLHRKLKIEHYETHKRSRVNTCGPEWQSVLIPLVAPVTFSCSYPTSGTRHISLDKRSLWRPQDFRCEDFYSTTKNHWFSSFLYSNNILSMTSW